jgi:hypothetical protein
VEAQSVKGFKSQLFKIHFTKMGFFMDFCLISPRLDKEICPGSAKPDMKDCIKRYLK